MMSSVTETDRRCRWMARLLSFLRVSWRIVRVMYGLIIHRIFFMFYFTQIVSMNGSRVVSVFLFE